MFHCSSYLKRFHFGNFLFNIILHETFQNFYEDKPDGIDFVFKVYQPVFGLKKYDYFNRLYVTALNYAKAVRSVGVPRPSLSVQKPLQRDGTSKHTNWMKYYSVSAAWTMERHTVGGFG